MAFLRLDEEVTTVGLVTGGHFLSHFYLLTFPPLFPLLRTELSLTNTELGLIVAVLSAAMVLQVFVGEVVDRVGAKRVFVAGIALTALGVLSAGLAPSYLALLAFAGLSGLGQSAFHPAGYPLLETVSDPDRVGKNFSIHTFGGYVGFAVVPLVVGGIGFTYGWRTALLAVGSIGLVYAAVVAVALSPVYRANMNGNGSDSEPQSDRQPTNVREVFLRPVILVMAAFFILVTMASIGIQSFTTILAIDGFELTETAGNTALSVFFAGTALCVLVGGVLADRYEPTGVILIAATVSALAMFALIMDVISITRTTFIALFALSGGSYGLTFASRDRLVSTYAAAQSTGRSFGFVFTVSAFGQLLSPVLLGAVIDFSVVTNAFVLVGVFFLLSGLVVLVLRR